jgi:HEAT repeat protein
MHSWWFLSFLALLPLPGIRRGWRLYSHGYDDDGQEPGCGMAAIWGLFYLVCWVMGGFALLDDVCRVPLLLVNCGWPAPFLQVTLLALVGLLGILLLFGPPLAVAVTSILAELLATLVLTCRVPFLIKRLRHGESAIRIRACQRLQVVGPAARAAVPTLVRCLTADRDTERWAAARALAVISPAALVPVVPWLLDSLSRRTSRREARQVLDPLGNVPALAIPPLVEALKEPRRRSAAAYALRQFGNRSLPALPQVVEALRSGNPAQRQVMAEMLERLGPQAQAAVPDLSHALEDSDPKVRMRAADALAKIGPDAHNAVPSLIGCLWDDHEGVRHAAGNALVGIGAAAVASLEVALLDAPEPFVRRRAAMTLGRLGPAARPALDALEAAANDADPEVAQAARRALERLRRPQPEGERGA